MVGVPQDIESARTLATKSGHDGRYQFEYWALGLVDARPGNNRRRGADAGVDGYINFFDDNSGKAKTVLVQVKSGHVQRNIVATLKGDMEREKAEMGLLVTLEPPTRPMEQEAAAAGLYVPEHFPDRQYPARADRDHRGPAERQRAGRAAPGPSGRADVPPRRAASELGGRCSAAALVAGWRLWAPFDGLRANGWQAQGERVAGTGERGRCVRRGPPAFAGAGSVWRRIDGRLPVPGHPASGSRILSSGNNEKSRSLVRSVSTPWATHMAAILASCTTPPMTRGRRTRPSSISGKALRLPQSDARKGRQPKRRVETP